jgi:DNA-directed RNA polymerase subunit RPC12/RpoP
MLKGMDELAMENGMLPPKGLCAGCWKGTYEDIVEDYHIGGETIKDLDLNRCPKCGHTTLPWTSVERVDKVLEEARKAAQGLNGGKNESIN